MSREAERAYSPSEAADIKGVSKKHVLRAIARTDALGLPAKRHGQGYRIKASDLDAWFERWADA